MGDTYNTVAWFLVIFTVVSFMCMLDSGEIGLLAIFGPLLLLWTSPLIWKYGVLGWLHARSM